MKQDIDGYIKLSVLGRGAYSTIYLSRNRSTGEICAIKQVDIKRPEEMKYIGHLEQEHAIASKFDHPVLRKTFKVIYNRKWFKVSSGALVMEYADGRPLADMMPSNEYVRMLKIFRHVAMGLDTMHINHFVHADLKPENMIINSEDRVKIIDYGQSFEMGQAKERVQGTVDYIAPEQTRREILDQRTDVFGLGAVMHRVFTDEPLQTEMNRKLNNHTLANVGKRVQQGNPLLTSGLPPMLIKLISDCCQPDRENRPPHMRAVVNLIELTIIKIQSMATQTAQSAPVLPDAPEDESGEFPAVQIAH
ncbi:MAG: Serine/threonine-protein kinase PknD [Phycisphaerae bacterium]|nr:Serine/threonine-protein kinase PknD [Phycisphaerae bacterium]